MAKYKVYNDRLTNILPGAEIGDDTTIGAFTEIGKAVSIGTNCKIQAFVFIPKGVHIGNGVFIGPSVVFTNDRYPSAKEYGLYEITTVEDDVAIGAGSTIRCGITLGKGCRIGAGSMVTKDVAPGALVVGNPAREVK